jgi:pimeloyl-ACP methyl ester carboxylesterase
MRFIQLLRAVTGILTLVVLLAAVGAPRADVIIFKDGFTLLGDVKREGQTVFEGGQAIKVGNGFDVLDDNQTLPDGKEYIRRIVFPARQVQDVDGRTVNQTADFVILRQPLTPFSTATRMEAIGPILETSAFDANWKRTLKYQPLKKTVANPDKVPLTTDQRLTYLTPYCARVESSRHLWHQMYLTRELGPDVVRQLLYTHPDLREKEGQVDPAKRAKVIRFLKQAGFYETAGQELEQWLKDAPSHKDKIDAERASLQRLQIGEALEGIDRAYRAGQHAWIQKQLAKIPMEGADDKQQRQVRTLKTKYEEAEEALTHARRFLKELPPRCYPEAQAQLFAEAAAAILAELHVDSHQRLATFVALARQAERDRQQNRPVTQTPGDLMALAVSGWLLGNASAEAKAETGIKLWKARKFVQSYQKTDNDRDREKLLAAYEQNRTDAISFDEMAQLISQLPPPLPEEKLPTNELLPLETKLPGERRGSSYILQLPRDYHHGRSYPLLIVLHQAGEKPKDAIERWGDLPYQQGYLTAVPEWGKNNGQGGYNFSAQEHAAVLNTIRDLQRRFNVDSDRVFLAGAGQGGDMAFDVGLSHPDQFAGVVAVGAQPRYFGKAYGGNGQVLPHYVVCGELASDAPKAIREQFKNHFVPRAAPALYVEYRGRAQEWFAGELPTMFDWMSRKKRALPVPELSQCISMRPTDSRFYWLSGEEINERSLNDISNWKPLVAAATLQGKIGPSNTIYLHATNWKKVTLWLTRGMIEFDKPVTVLLNTTTRMNQKSIKPSLAVLLEDFYQRGDRQRLFLAKIDLPLSER